MPFVLRTPHLQLASPANCQCSEYFAQPRPVVIDWHVCPHAQAQHYLTHTSPKVNTNDIGRLRGSRLSSSERPRIPALDIPAATQDPCAASSFSSDPRVAGRRQPLREKRYPL